MNASNKRRTDEKKCGVYSRAAFNNDLLVCTAFIRVITICGCNNVVKNQNFF